MEKIQQALLRLSIPKGSFPFDLALGSRLHTLQGAHGPSLDRTALSYATEALADMSDITVHSARCRWLSPDVLEIRIGAVLAHFPLQLEVTFP